MKSILVVLLTLSLSGCVIFPPEGPGKSALVCHKGKKTLELPAEAARAHLNHGDHPGPCR